MIEFKDIVKIFSTKQGEFSALSDINLKVDQGEIFGIIGKSGAGKSTLLRCTNLLEKPSQGRVLIDGIDLLSLTAKQLRMERKKVGMIFQHFNLLSQLTVSKNIALALHGSALSKAKRQERVEKLLQVIDLEDKAHSYPGELSGGQKQRVAIARALANRPSVLLCDEATSALDTETTGSILTLLKKINKEFGVTVLLITHQIEVVKAICDRVAIIQKGALVEVTKTADFFAKPHSIEGRTLLSMHAPLHQVGT